MYRRTRLLLAGLGAALVLASAVGIAAARNLSLSNQTFRQTWAPLTMSVTGPFEGTRTIRCNATIEGSFHTRSIAKVVGTLIGYITSERFAHPCTGGEVWSANGTEVMGGSTVESTLPWHIRYDGFTGTLPSITTIRVRAVLHIWYRLVEGQRCLYMGAARSSLTREAGGAITTFAPEAAATLPLINGVEFCPPEISLQGPAGGFTVLNSTTRITVTLI